MTIRTFLSICFGSAVLLSYSCRKDPVSTLQPPDTTDTTDTTTIKPALYTRDSAIKDYTEMFLATEISNIDWTGSTANCDPGNVPQSVHDAVIKRINYFRKITGLNYNCILDASLIPAQQRTALMMAAAGDLSHDPGTNWPCYTAEGADGAKKSNLRLGSAATDAVVAFMNDEEEYNQAVGHRRWLLYSKQSAFSHGSTYNTAVIHVLVKADNSKIPEFIAYPPATYVPYPVIYHRWSFSIPGADFTNTQVSMSHNGKDIPVQVVSRTEKVADNTIVWEPQETMPEPTTGDLIYTVTVSEIGNAPKSTYSYNVTIIKP